MNALKTIIDMMSLLQIQISTMELFSLIASITSIILGITAIVLSILFYRMSVKIGRENEKTSTNIESSVNKLENLFDKLYTGTFDMMKETVTDMRKHVYKSGDTANSNERDKKILDTTISNLSDEINRLKSKKIDGEETEKIVEEILKKSKKIELDIRKQKVRKEIENYLTNGRKAKFRDIEIHIINMGLVTKSENILFRELQEMSKAGIVNDPFEIFDYNVEGVGTDEYFWLL